MTTTPRVFFGQKKFVAVNSYYFETTFLDVVWEQLLKQTPSWAAGLSVPTPVERFAYEMLNEMPKYETAKTTDQPENREIM